MASSKAKKGLGDMFRHAMRHHKKSLDGSHETVSLSSVLEFGQGKSSASGSNRLRERNEDEGSSNNASEKFDFFHKEFLFWSRLKQEPRYRKQTDHYKEKHSKIMKKMEEGFARKVGIENLFSVCAKMGKEVGVNEYNGMIKVCIHSARISDDVEAALDHIRKAIEYLKEINKCGSIIGKGTYVPLLKFLVDMGMVEEFQISKDVIIEANPDALGQVGYYEMLLWIQVGDEVSIDELCCTIDDSENSLSILQGKQYMCYYIGLELRFFCLLSTL
ncbi:pentatricopeptide repeat-containing protein At4g21880, mitochondrial-like isoform X1 [Arabidopsis lyrata subsp. lyrata]|uniref:pentatricopeptide repeat-containing protein At4g21880, mitochondrial-like isoform X1 n=1 Tax=Arabidopsis lyrata subsp. lyrata TaxID=81972 RepID=UPI000A29B798|nr:pentatricopeptide repeat-containing protein At4g21880, mitochondrial-like isoform X1 [Arabidopsis lyrata subsp. lyrata]|eukprot:XP_020873667.1 pentatricopeptide repeat-containing protein At4g21880, mitochondrial-like isoform X1 [Arabidopsis lyrata subsp. lyrata]